MPAKPKPLAAYPLQIWLTAVLLGPMILYFLNFHDYSFPGFFEIYGLMLVIGLCFSIPCFMLLLAGVAMLDMLPYHVFVKKGVVFCLTMILGTVPFMLILGGLAALREKSNFIIVASYLAPLLASALYYRWPSRVRAAP